MSSAPLAPNTPPLPDAFMRTVSIPIRVRGSKILSLDGSALPTLHECVGDLIVPAYAVRDPDALQYLSAEELQQLFDKGDVLLCRLSPRHIPAKLLARCRLEVGPNWAGEAPFVEIRLEEPLMLRWRGTKKAKLQPARCTIPALDDRPAESVNEAYRQISEIFEPTRRSAGGNVFLNVYYLRVDDHQWRQMDELRGGLPLLDRYR